MKQFLRWGSTRDFKPAGSMLRKLFLVLMCQSDLLLLEDAQSIQIKKYVGSLALKT
jgi:hypothetical protein